MKLRWLLFLPLLLASEEVKIALDYLPNPNHVPLYVACKKGYFAEEGIELEILRMIDRPQTMTLLEAKRADIAIYCMIPTLRAACRFDDFKIVGTYINHPLMAFNVKESSDIKEPKDFAGKVIGARPGGTISAILNNFAKVEKITYKDVISVHFDMPLALALDKVDAVSDGLWNIEPFMMEAAGIKVHSMPCVDFHVPHHSELIFLMHNDTLQKKPKLKESFLRALAKGVAFAKERPDEAFEIYTTYLPNKSKKTLAWERKAWEVTVNLFASDLGVNAEEVQKLHTWLSERELLSKSYSIKKLLL